MKKLLFFVVVVNCILCGCASNQFVVEESTTTTITSTVKETEKVVTTVEKPKYPYKGMSESQVENTQLGNATSIEKCIDFSKVDNTHKWKKYIWDYGEGKKLVATIYYDDGYGKVFEVEKYPIDPYGNELPGYWE